MKKIEKYIIAVIVLIAIGAIGTAIYFVINEVNNNHNQTNNDDELFVETGKIDVFSSNIIINEESLINKLPVNSLVIINEANKYLNSRINDKLFHYLDKTYNSLNEIDNQNKLWLAYWITKDDKHGKYITDYTSDEITTILKKLFGSNFSLFFEDIKLGEEVYYRYNQDTNKYESTGAGSGALLFTPVRMKCIDFKVINNKYYITYKSAYQLTGDGPDNIIYNADQKQVLELSWEKDMINDEFYLSNENFDKIYNNLTETTFVFEKYNNNLVLTGYIVNII